jgi:DUF1016 N-terminal domain
MSETTHNPVPAPADGLHAELRALIASSRQRLAGAVNAELTRLYWSVGQRLRTEVLGESRASYGAQLLDQLGQQLSQEFGRGFESRNLRRMVKFAESFPDAAILSTLSTKLSWSHMVAIVALKTPQARQFYASQAAQDGWSVRERDKNAVGVHMLCNSPFIGIAPGDAFRLISFLLAHEVVTSINKRTLGRNLCPH